jgi:hypothetical protein
MPTDASDEVSRRMQSCYSKNRMRRIHYRRFAYMGLLLAVALIACHKEEQAAAGVAKTAVNAEEKAQAASETAQTEIDRERAALEDIPLPTKSMYVDVHEPGAWANPFLSVDADTIDLRVTMADANPSTMGQGTLLRPTGARRQELMLRTGDVPEALIALPAGAWRYGRVVAVAESPLADPKNRPRVRRNVEAVLKQLSDLGVVAEEWPARD